MNLYLVVGVNHGYIGDAPTLLEVEGLVHHISMSLILDKVVVTRTDDDTVPSDHRGLQDIPNTLIQKRHTINTTIQNYWKYAHQHVIQHSLTNTEYYSWVGNFAWVPALARNLLWWSTFIFQRNSNV